MRKVFTLDSPRNFPFLIMSINVTIFRVLPCAAVMDDQRAKVFIVCLVDIAYGFVHQGFVPNGINQGFIRVLSDTFHEDVHLLVPAGLADVTGRHG